MSVNMETIYVAGLFKMLNGLFNWQDMCSDSFSIKQIYTGWIRKENLTKGRPLKY